MIIDAFIAAIALVFEPILFIIIYLLAGAVNLLLGLLELTIGLFIHGFSLKRIPKRDWKREKLENKPPSKYRIWGSLCVLAVIILLMSFLKFKDKEVHFVATDGNSLPYAEIVITTNNEVIKKRTSISGKIEVPRFGLVSLKINDPRYKDQTWTGEEIKSELVVKRSLIGSGLDTVVDFIKKEKK